MKAMMGSGIDSETLRLLDEIRALRARVAELEQALATAAQVEQVDDDEVRIDVPAVLETTAAGR